MNFADMYPKGPPIQPQPVAHAGCPESGCVPPCPWASVDVAYTGANGEELFRESDVVTADDIDDTTIRESCVGKYDLPLPNIPTNHVGTYTHIMMVDGGYVKVDTTVTFIQNPKGNSNG